MIGRCKLISLSPSLRIGKVIDRHLPCLRPLLLWLFKFRRVLYPPRLFDAKLQLQWLRSARCCQFYFIKDAVPETCYPLAVCQSFFFPVILVLISSGKKFRSSSFSCSCVSKQWRATIDLLYPLPLFLHGTVQTLTAPSMEGFHVLLRRHNTDEFLCASNQHSFFRFNFSRNEQVNPVPMVARDGIAGTTYTQVDRDTVLARIAFFDSSLMDINTGLLQPSPPRDAEHRLAGCASRNLHLGWVASSGARCVRDTQRNQTLILPCENQLMPISGTLYADRYLVVCFISAPATSVIGLQSLQVFDLHHPSGIHPLLNPMPTARMIFIRYGWQYVLLTDESYSQLQFFSLEDLRLMPVLEPATYSKSSHITFGTTGVNVFDDFCFLAHCVAGLASALGPYVWRWSIDIWNVRSGKLLRTILPEEIPSWICNYPPTIEYDAKARLLVLFYRQETSLFQLVKK